MSYVSSHLTPENIARAAELIRNNYGEPEIEYHSPRCPKLLSEGKMACRCGACPLEAVFEDALEENK